jgi:2-hydroxy-3-keto-5-methylthiopentenyl-1-phosphate phosphatase
MKIPKTFKLFGTTYNIVWDNDRLNDRNEYGLCDYSRSEIILSNTIGVKKLSDDKIMDTYYHEKTHAILDMMNERELSSNEKFVDVFSKLLRQSDETSEF